MYILYIVRHIVPYYIVRFDTQFVSNASSFQQKYLSICLMCHY